MWYFKPFETFAEYDEYYTQRRLAFFGLGKMVFESSFKIGQLKGTAAEEHARKRANDVDLWWHVD